MKRKPEFVVRPEAGEVLGGYEGSSIGLLMTVSDYLHYFAEELGDIGPVDLRGTHYAVVHADGATLRRMPDCEVSR